MKNLRAENIELDLLLEGAYQLYGHDFRAYSKASVKRRVKGFMEKAGIATISGLQHQVLHKPALFEKLLGTLSINYTEMFRDPDFYTALKSHVLPELRKKSKIRIWQAGCATGEQTWSLAIFLKEQGLYDKSFLYATDFDEQALETARQGVYPEKQVRSFGANYLKAGGGRQLIDYFRIDPNPDRDPDQNKARLDPGLKKNILFSNHNLAGDGVFGAMDLIICRNVLIYFSRELQDRVFQLFTQSLNTNGILCLGPKETIRVSNWSHTFADISPSQKIYRLAPQHEPPNDQQDIP